MNIEKLEKFKKELKNIDTKTLLRKEKDQEVYGAALKNDEVIYNLYYHHMLLCGYEPTDLLLKLIDEFGYRILKDTVRIGAVMNSKELNKQIVMVVK